MYNTKIVLTIFIIAILVILVISIILSGGFGNFLKNIRLALVHGQFQIIGEPATVVGIYLEHFYPTQDFTNCTDTYTDCWTDPLENSTRNPTIKVMIRDGNGDCNNDALFDVYVTVCTPGMSTCSAANFDRTVELTFDSQSLDNAYCNYSYQGTLLGFDYYETPGDWGIYANVTDDDGTTWNSNEPYEHRFEYTALAAFLYPAAGSTVGMGTLSLGMWNYGTGDTGTDPEAKNIGNVKQNVTWNASDFQRQGGGATLQITGFNYVIDDDKDGVSDLDNFQQVYINDDPTQEIIFPFNSSAVPPTYLDVCSNFNCDGLGDYDARFNIYWHIEIPAGQQAGTYSNDITITNVEI